MNRHRNAQILYSAPSHLRFCLGAAGAAFLTFALISCHDGGDASPPPPEKPYLDVALDNNDFFRWTPRSGSQTILVPIQVNDDNVPASYDSSTMKSVIVEARNVWKREIREVVDLSTSTIWRTEKLPFYPKYAKIEINFEDSLPDGKTGAVAVLPANGGPWNTVKMTLAMRQGPNKQLLTADQLRAVAIHEFGHAYGIYKFGPEMGHSNSENDVMRPSNTSQTKLSEADVLSIQALYRMTPTRRRFDG